MPRYRGVALLRRTLKENLCSPRSHTFNFELFLTRDLPNYHFGRTNPLARSGGKKWGGLRAGPPVPPGTAILFSLRRGNASALRSGAKSKLYPMGRWC